MLVGTKKKKKSKQQKLMLNCLLTLTTNMHSHFNQAESRARES